MSLVSVNAQALSRISWRLYHDRDPREFKYIQGYRVDRVELECAPSKTTLKIRVLFSVYQLEPCLNFGMR